MIAMTWKYKKNSLDPQNTYQRNCSGEYKNITAAARFDSTAVLGFGLEFCFKNVFLPTF